MLPLRLLIMTEYSLLCVVYCSVPLNVSVANSVDLGQTAPPLGAV